MTSWRHRPHCPNGATHETERNDQHDAYFCPLCDIWVEDKCSDMKCQYCPGRPDQPSGKPLLCCRIGH